MATPDEEYESQGILSALPEWRRFAAARGLEVVGVLNLDYCLEPSVWLGVVGKLQLGCYIIGSASHVGERERSPDALRLAAEIVRAVAGGESLIDASGSEQTAAPAVLRIDDLRVRYSIEPVTEAIVEFSVLSMARPLSETLHTARRVVENAIAALIPSASAGAGDGEAGGNGRRVWMLPELAARAGSSARPEADAAPGDARAQALERVRGLCRAARIGGPAAVLYLAPPFYPAAEPRDGALGRAARVVAEQEGLAVRAYYPFISDASYVAWRAPAPDELARHFPGLGHSYRLSIEASRELDLEVVNLGPWGRDAHRVYERVHAPYAFGRLPGLIESVVKRAGGLMNGPG